jgi:hypothetical protein
MARSRVARLANLGDGRIWEDGETKNTFSFNGTGRKTQTLIIYVHYDDDDISVTGCGLI